MQAPPGAEASCCRQSYERKRIRPLQQQQSAQPSRVTSITSGGGGALAGPPSSVNIVPSGVVVPLCSALCCEADIELAPNPVFRELLSNGVILVHKTCLIAPFRANARCLTGVRHVRYQTDLRQVLAEKRL